MVALLVSWGPWELSIRYPAFFSLLIVGSGLLGGLWSKLGVVPGRAWVVLAQVQAFITPVLIPLLPWWIGFRDYDVVYWDENVSIELVLNPGMISEIATTRITVYQSQALLFEKPISYIDAIKYPHYPHTNEDFNQKQWWTTVRHVRVEADFLSGVIQRQAEDYPFVLNKLRNRE